MFNHTNTYPIYDLKSKTTKTGRFYTTPEGIAYPSVTTVLGSDDAKKEWLQKWKEAMGAKADRETKRAAERGTAVHEMIEKHLNNDPACTEGYANDHKRLFLQLRLYLKKINNIEMQEAALWSDTLRLAGRVDCIAEYDGVLSVIDFKTSTRDKDRSKIGDYFLQTAAYAIMFEERYGKRIDQSVIIMASEKGGWPNISVEPIDPHVTSLLKRISTYYKGQP